MRTQRRAIQIPFEACSLALFAFVALINAPSARAQTFGPAPTVKSTPSRSTATQAVTPPKSAASSPKR